jgi:uncharacterized membrane protein YgaE (UPF0421/DUF939 family)
MADRLTGAWERVVASDPGLTRLRMAATTAVAVATTLAVGYGYANVRNFGRVGTLLTMAIGGVVALLGSVALLTIATVWAKVRIALLCAGAFAVGLLIAVGVGQHTNLMLGALVVIMAAAVAIRRFGIEFFFYGMFAWIGYLMATLFHARLSAVPQLMEAVGVAMAWGLLLALTVLRAHPTRTLRHARRAISARSQAVLRACADLLEAAGADNRRRRRSGRRLHARRAQLAEAALMAEAWSAEPGALLPDTSAARLRRDLIDAQHIFDRLAASAEALSTGDPLMAPAAADVARRLARRDYSGANQAARRLAETDQQPTKLGAERVADIWSPARQFAVAAIEVVDQARQGEFPGPAGTDPVDELPALGEFRPATNLAMGQLPGSATAAAAVPGRGARWNALARLDLPARQAIQVAISGGLATWAGWALSSQRYYWAVLAAFVVSIGTTTRAETVIKAINRTLGTLAGIVAGIWLAEQTAGSTGWALVIVVTALFCGLYLLRLAYGYMIFFLTIAVGQLYGLFGEFSHALMVLRLKETALGAAIGGAVAMVVVPLSTRDTTRSARANLLAALSELLAAAADRLDGTTIAGADLDALIRRLEDQQRQVTLTMKPFTMPLIFGNMRPRAHHRLDLYAATTAHARALAIALRHPYVGDATQLAAACRALASAAADLAATRHGELRRAVTACFANADSALLTHISLTPDSSGTDAVTHSLVQLEYLLLDLTGAPAVGRPYLAGTASEYPAPPGHRSLVASAFHPDQGICNNLPVTDGRLGTRPATTAP